MFSKYLLLILQSIIAVQAVAPTLKGASKKQLVVDLTELTAGVLQTFPNDKVQQTGAIIDGSVKILQTAGVIEKDQVPAA